MYGECSDKSVCNATSHWKCKYCQRNLCELHYVLHKIKQALFKRCVLIHRHH